LRCNLTGAGAVLSKIGPAKMAFLAATTSSLLFDQKKRSARKQFFGGNHLIPGLACVVRDRPG
jgi:hypothetical protein